VRFGYLRSGKEHTATVTLGPPPAFPPPPQEPILRIEAGMPMGHVTSVGADAACTLLATASEDATLRMWRVRDGKLLRTLRAPASGRDPPSRSGRRSTRRQLDCRWRVGREHLELTGLSF
jgi:hypothetical protein